MHWRCAVAETTTYQCPNCNGRLSYAGDIGKLKCEFCESEFTPAEVEAIYAQRQAASDAAAAKDREREQREQAAAAGDGAGASQGAGGAPAAAAPPAVHVAAPVAGESPIDTYLRNAHWDNLAEEDLRSFNCSSCGAQLLVDQVTAVTHCPYCGNNAVVPGQLSDMLKPDYVIPFKLDRNAAIAALKNYYSGKKLLPNAFTDENHIEEIQGVYVPFWLYSGTGSGEVTMNGRNIRTWTDSENMYTETDHYLLHRAGEMEFHRVPVDGSTKMPDAHMDAIEPFDYSELVPFSVAYLPGYLTDRYDQDAKTCEHRATDRVRNTVSSELQNTVAGFAEVDLANADTDLDLSEVAYALLPVWMLHTKWDGQDFLFAMNGQTGKLIGDLPIDRGKVIKQFLITFFPTLVIVALVVLFLLGGYSM